MDSDLLSLVRLRAMIKLSFCWSSSSTTPTLAFSDAGHSMQWTMSMEVSLTSAGKIWLNLEILTSPGNWS